MPYGDLASQAVQRFTSVDDLVAARATIEEREEYEPHLAAGTVVYAGVDYHAILERAQAEADVLLWDGGNNDLPFYRPDLHIVVADPLRAGHESSYHPGEANARAADVLVINKVDEATAEQVAALEEQLKQLNADAVVVKAASPVRVEDPELVTGKRVLVIEDGPTLTHGEMSYGAGRGRRPPPRRRRDRRPPPLRWSAPWPRCTSATRTSAPWSRPWATPTSRSASWRP